MLDELTDETNFNVELFNVSGIGFVSSQYTNLPTKYKSNTTGGVKLFYSLVGLNATLFSQQ